MAKNRIKKTSTAVKDRPTPADDSEAETPKKADKASEAAEGQDTTESDEAALEDVLEAPDEVAEDSEGNEEADIESQAEPTAPTKIGPRKMNEGQVVAIRLNIMRGERDKALAMVDNLEDLVAQREQEMGHLRKELVKMRREFRAKLNAPKDTFDLDKLNRSVGLNDGNAFKDKETGEWFLSPKA